MTAVPAVLLQDFALLRFSGDDAASFLHGQLTCDVNALKPGSACYGGYCTPKGRLLATFLLWRRADGFLMLVPAALSEGVRKRLSMYILRSKVNAEDLSSTLAWVGLHGDDMTAALARIQAGHPDPVPVVELAGGRRLAAVPREGLDLPADDGRWAAADIAAGIPFILPATQEEFVPQMVNLDLIGALSYSKGCYPGQEIVARTHYLGRLKQRMYRATVAAAAAPGDTLHCAELGEQSAGMIVNAAPAPGGRQQVLAVLQSSNATGTPYHLGSLQGPQLALAELPYHPR